MKPYRPEVKMTGSVTLQNAALALLDHFCDPDPLFPRGEIHSVYYDTPAQHAYHDKANGDFAKAKARLRWYNPDVSADPARSTAFFELKRRRGGFRSRIPPPRYLMKVPLVNLFRMVAPDLIHARMQGKSVEKDELITPGADAVVRGHVVMGAMHPLTVVGRLPPVRNGFTLKVPAEGATLHFLR